MDIIVKLHITWRGEEYEKEIVIPITLILFGIIVVAAIVKLALSLGGHYQ